MDHEHATFDFTFLITSKPVIIIQQLCASMIKWLLIFNFVAGYNIRQQSASLLKLTFSPGQHSTPQRGLGGVHTGRVLPFKQPD